MFAPFFYVLFGLILLFIEVGYKQEEIYEQFKFMKTYVGRGLFHFLLACLVTATISADVAKIIWGTILCLPGVYYLIMACMGKREFDFVVRNKVKEPEAA